MLALTALIAASPFWTDAASPLWTDKVVAFTAMIASVGAFAALGLALRQLKLQTDQLRLQTRELEIQTKQDERSLEIRTAQRAFDLMRLLVDVGRPVIEHPELGPYLHEGKALPRNKKLLSQVIACASGFISLAETVGWQIKANQLGAGAEVEWARYFTRLHDTSPAVRSVVDRDREMLAQETLVLFGIENSRAVND